MKTKFLFFLIFFFTVAYDASSQNVYRTFSGDIAIGITNHDSIVLLVSNSLFVTLDYETSKISFHVARESFRTGIDSFDSRLKLLNDTAIEFAGKIGITINSKRYDLQKYNMEGTITSMNPPVPVRGNGSMSCIPSGDNLTPACTLLLAFETTLSALHLDNIFKTANTGVQVNLRQSILEREKQ